MESFRSFLNRHVLEHIKKVLDPLINEGRETAVNALCLKLDTYEAKWWLTSYAIEVFAKGASGHDVDDQVVEDACTLFFESGSLTTLDHIACGDPVEKWIDQNPCFNRLVEEAELEYLKHILKPTMLGNPEFVTKRLLSSPLSSDLLPDCVKSWISRFGISVSKEADFQDAYKINNEMLIIACDTFLAIHGNRMAELIEKFDTPAPRETNPSKPAVINNKRARTVIAESCPSPR